MSLPTCWNITFLVIPTRYGDGVYRGEREERERKDESSPWWVTRSVVSVRLGVKPTSTLDAKNAAMRHSLEGGTDEPTVIREFFVTQFSTKDYTSTSGVMTLRKIQISIT